MIALGADHVGWQLKEEIKAWLLDKNAELLDLGTHRVLRARGDARVESEVRADVAALTTRFPLYPDRLR